VIAVVAGNNYAVTFSEAQPDTNYQIVMDFDGYDRACALGNLGIISKTVNGFTMDPGPGPTTCAAGAAVITYFSIVR